MSSKKKKKKKGLRETLGSLTTKAHVQCFDLRGFFSALSSLPPSKKAANGSSSISPLHLHGPAIWTRTSVGPLLWQEVVGSYSFKQGHTWSAGFGPHNSHWLRGPENLESANGKHLAELEFKLSEHGPWCLLAHSVWVAKLNSTFNSKCL